MRQPFEELDNNFKQLTNYYGYYYLIKFVKYITCDIFYL